MIFNRIAILDCVPRDSEPAAKLKEVLGLADELSAGTIDGSLVVFFGYT